MFLTQRFDLTARCARAVCSATIAAHVPAGVLFENLERWHIDNLPVDPLLCTFLREETRHQRASTPTSLSLQGSTEPLGDEVHKEGWQPPRLPRAQCLWLHYTAGERDWYRRRCCSSAPADLCPWSCRREKLATNTMPLASLFAGEQDRCRHRRCNSTLADPVPPTAKGTLKLMHELRWMVPVTISQVWSLPPGPKAISTSLQMWSSCMMFWRYVPQRLSCGHEPLDQAGLVVLLDSVSLVILRAFASRLADVVGTSGLLAAGFFSSKTRSRRH